MKSEIAVFNEFAEFILDLEHLDQVSGGDVGVFVQPLAIFSYANIGCIGESVAAPGQSAYVNVSCTEFNQGGPHSNGAINTLCTDNSPGTNTSCFHNRGCG